jgi:hypothetical protein
MRVGACARCRCICAKPERIGNAGDTVVSPHRAWHDAPVRADRARRRLGAHAPSFRRSGRREPTRLRVDEHTSGPPAVWLHADGSTTAWIIVDTAQQAWSQLAYQFGHELGHVMANSWQPHAKPAAPCQWLEEAIVEAFSLRGLGRLAENWKQHPPFAGDNAYGAAIAEYRQNIVQRYAKLAAEQGIIGDTGAWFAGHREEIEAPGGLHGFAQAASVIVLTEYERTPDCVEAVGALNRWPGRSGVPIAEYLHDWEASCVELQASPALPVHLREMLRIV